MVVMKKLAKPDMEPVMERVGCGRNVFDRIGLVITNHFEFGECRGVGLLLRNRRKQRAKLEAGITN